MTPLNLQPLFHVINLQPASSTDYFSFQFSFFLFYLPHLPHLTSVDFAALIFNAIFKAFFSLLVIYLDCFGWFLIGLSSPLPAINPPFMLLSNVIFLKVKINLS